MAQDGVTGATETVEEVTAESAEEPTVTGSEIQDNSEKLDKLEAELRAFADKIASLTEENVQATKKAIAAEEARKKAEEERDREIKVRVGHQRESTAKLQELAALKAQLANQTITQQKLNRMEKMVAEMASRQLDPSEVEKINRDIEQEQQRQELEQLRKEVQSRSEVQQAPELTRDYKNQLYRAYFSEFDVNPHSLSEEEWHQYDSNDQAHWYQQVRAEFAKHQAAKAALAKAESADEIYAKVKADMEATLKVLREEDATKLAETQAALKAAQTEAAEAKRLAEEQLNRSRGMDRDHESVSEPSVEKKAQDALRRTPPVEWLYGTPEQKKAYHEAMNNKSLRNEILSARR